jgi:hypothetical protein
LATVQFRLENVGGSPTVEDSADRFCLDPDVVELQNSEILLSAIDAGMVGEVLDQPPSQRFALRFPRRCHLRAVEGPASAEVRAKALTTPMLPASAGTVERRFG